MRKGFIKKWTLKKAIYWNNDKTLKQKLAYIIWSYCATIRSKVKPHI